MISVRQLYDNTEEVYRDLPIHVEGKPAEFSEVVSQTDEHFKLRPQFLNLLTKEDV